jgi:hypothetical protein
MTSGSNILVSIGIDFKDPDLLRASARVDIKLTCPREQRDPSNKKLVLKLLLHVKLDEKLVTR